MLPELFRGGSLFWCGYAAFYKMHPSSMPIYCTFYIFLPSCAPLCFDGILLTQKLKVSKAHPETPLEDSQKNLERFWESKWFLNFRGAELVKMSHCKTVKSEKRMVIALSDILVLWSSWSCEKRWVRVLHRSVAKPRVALKKCCSREEWL